ncbi:hypothetical protein HCG46_17520 [Labrenzia sp. PO1]|uniref:hypothetical protein n=1 Tax=Labrenzia sp. PO1 TaxID=2720390 RepID=UPI001444A2F6|nr:hypothetical protein [Labrenzia sp. PO1]NKI60067.1 hypothetical protein [Labrenzia sp. PO1]
MANSPVKDVSLGDALKISLDNYYDLLITQVGTLKADEKLQLKLVADPVSVSDKKFADGGYPWFSYYNLLRRSDLSIVPKPVSGGVMTGVAGLSDVYGEFLQKLRSFVVRKNLSKEDQIALADLDKKVEFSKKSAVSLIIEDRTNWKEFAEAMGYSVTDQSAYVQWSGQFGNLYRIETEIANVKVHQFEIKTILDRQYPNADDRQIVDAEFDFNNPAMRLRYPINPDTDYANGDKFTIEYLATLPTGNTAGFDDRRAVGWNLTAAEIKTTTAGGFAQGVSFDKSTSSSSSITTDWGASGSASYGLISVKASVSDHKRIQEEFSKTTKITLFAESAFRLSINYPAWFKPVLFEHRHIKENPYDFEKYFGEDGTLLYYPTGLILVRGFGVEFLSAQNWMYDYRHRFSASGGGGFGFAGINFGAAANYSEDTKQHQTDQQTTTLSFKDDIGTMRFVGYAVTKNRVFEKAVSTHVTKTLQVNKFSPTEARAKPGKRGQKT